MAAEELLKTLEDHIPERCRLYGACGAMSGKLIDICIEHETGQISEAKALDQAQRHIDKAASLCSDGQRLVAGDPAPTVQCGMIAAWNQLL